MHVFQNYQLANAVTKELLGETAVINEDLSNFVDIGKQIMDVTAVDNYVKTLIDQIGKIEFSSRKYKGKMVSVMREYWEYGSVKMKVSMGDLPDASENDTWNLVDGQTYNQDEFVQPKDILVKFFNHKTTFEIPMSYTYRQVLESLQSPEQYDAFVGMIKTNIDNSIEVKNEAFAKRTVTNFMAETIVDCFGTTTPDYTQVGNTRCVNLLKMYNTEFGTSLTAEKAIKDPDFLRYASLIMGLYIDRLREESKLFNIGATAKFTPADKLHVLLLSEFERGANVYLYGNKGEFKASEYAAFPVAETVSFWQGSGTDYSFAATSKINIKDTSGDTVEFSGVLGCMFDHEALGVSNYNRRTPTHENAKGEFVTAYNKVDAVNWNDLNENFVMFYVAA